MHAYQRDLSSSVAKHTRAKCLIEELDRTIQNYFADKSRQPGMRADLDALSGYHILRINFVPNFGRFLIDVGVMVGEVVHNLRSSLDHVAWQLACEFSGGNPVNPRRIAFPVCDPKSGHQHKNPDFFAVHDWMELHEFQPCKGISGRPDSWSGDYVHQLTLLHNMWNQDKHLTLPVIMATSNCFNLIPTRSTLPPWIVKTADSVEFLPERIRVPDPDAEVFDFSHSDKVVELNAEVGRIMVPAWRTCPAIEDAGTIIPRIALEDLRPISATLGRLADYVEIVLNSTLTAVVQI